MPWRRYVKKSLFAGPALLAAAALSFAGCAEPPGTGSSTAPTAGPSSQASASTGAADFKACMVSDSGGFDDKSFNQTSYKGLTDAKTTLGIETGQVESSAAADYAKNIDSMVKADCNMIVTVGFLLSDATVAAAKANPDIDFAIVDDNPASAKGLKNLKPLVFNTAESSFMAGYLAAGSSKTGTVGTFGGLPIPTVTIFMDGFAQGVQYYNDQKSKSVKLVGWNPENPKGGSFVPGDKPFENVAGGKQVATNLVSQGADIIFPVAGPAGEGGLQVAKASGGKVSAIWVDTDGCVSAESYCSSLVSSVFKGMDVAVTQAIKDSYEDKFDATAYVGTLENEGTGLAPYHEFDSLVPADLKAEVDKIKADIIAGTIKIDSASQPK